MRLDQLHSQALCLVVVSALLYPQPAAAGFLDFLLAPFSGLFSAASEENTPTTSGGGGGPIPPPPVVGSPCNAKPTGPGGALKCEMDDGTSCPAGESCMSFRMPDPNGGLYDLMYCACAPDALRCNAMPQCYMYSGGCDLYEEVCMANGYDQFGNESCECANTCTMGLNIPSQDNASYCGYGVQCSGNCPSGFVCETDTTANVGCMCEPSLWDCWDCGTAGCNPVLPNPIGGCKFLSWSECVDSNFCSFPNNCVDCDEFYYNCFDYSGGSSSQFNFVPTGVQLSTISADNLADANRAMDSQFPQDFLDATCDSFADSDPDVVESRGFLDCYGETTASGILPQIHVNCSVTCQVRME